MSGSALDAQGTFALVIQTRVAEEGAGAYLAWQQRIGERLQMRPGFLGQVVTAPSPPYQVDWIVVQRFQTLQHARAWMQSDELARHLQEVSRYFVGDEDIFLHSDVSPNELPASAILSCEVAPHDEAAFAAWESRLFQAEAKAPGFVGHKLNRPVSGIQPNWVTLVSFDTEENLTRWLESPVRAGLLEEGRRFAGRVRVRRSNLGFGMWARESTPPTSSLGIFKANLLCLLVLYPVVYLWGYFISGPFIDGHGVPPWLSLFVGNLVSTQLLGWLLVPKAMHLFAPWLVDAPPVSIRVAGWGGLVLLYALSMAGFAFLLTLPR